MNTNHFSYLVLHKVLLLFFLIFTLFIPSKVHASRLFQGGDPTDQCAEGVKLAKEGKRSEALPFLESGFSKRETGNFLSANDIGECASELGFIYFEYDLESALDAFTVAYESFKEADNKEKQSNSLNSIGAIYYTNGDLADALNYYMKALAIDQEIGDLRSEATVLNNISTVYIEQNQYPDALSYLNQELLIEKRINKRQSQARTINRIGEIQVHLGFYDEALEYFQQALIIEKEIGDKQGQANTLLGLGNLYSVQDYFPEALYYFQQAIIIQDSISDFSGEVDSLSSIAEIYQAQWNYSIALKYYEEGLKISRDIDDRNQEAEILNHMGVVYGTQGQYGIAVDFLYQSLGIRREIGDIEGEQITLLSLAGVHHRFEQYQDALSIYMEVLKTYREIGDRNGEAVALAAIGRIYSSQDSYAEAENYLQQALLIYKETNSKRGEGDSLYSLANNLVGRQDDLALSYFEQSLSIQKQIGNKEAEADILTGIGKVYHSKKNFSEAINLFKQSIAIDKEIGDIEGERINLTEIANVYFDLKDVESGLPYYESALEILERLRASSGNEENRADFIAQYSSQYTTGIFAYQIINRDDQAFHLSERGRSRAFLDSISTGYIELSDDSAKNLFVKEQEIYNQIISLQAFLQKAQHQSKKDEKLISSLEEQIDKMNHDHENVLEAIDARHDQLALLIPKRSAVLDLHQVQSLLDNNTTLVSYWIDNDVLIIFVVSKNDFYIVNTNTSIDEVVRLVTDFRFFPNLNDIYPKSATSLYQILIKPIKEYLNTAHLIIIPHNVLHYLPYSALTDGEHYLLDEYTVTYLPSASMLPFLQQDVLNNQGQNMLILGNPSTGNYDSASFAPLEKDQFPSLPFAEKEAKVIANLLDTNAYVGDDATETLVKQESPNIKVLHLAAHGLFDQRFPLNSLIALTPDQQNNGLLTIGEIYGLNLKNIDMVVLSACNTQIGQLSNGDELVGLTRAFFFAGSPTVISSLWEVDDMATELLMEKFYINWRKGMSKVEALRQAQIELRSEYPNPYYWAGFVLNGDGGRGSESANLPEEIPSRIPNCMSGLSISFLLTVVAMIRFRKTKWQV